MAFNFSGVFSNGDEGVMNDLLSQVPGVGRKVEQPFRGFGVKFGTERADNQAARDLV
jgi:hypothetical protein